jgi:hypothetical protein
MSNIYSVLPINEDLKSLLIRLDSIRENDKPISFAEIAEVHGLSDALWCCRVEPKYEREWRQFVVWCARQIQHLIKDPYCIEAVNVAERYLNGETSDADLSKAEEDILRNVSKDYASWKTITSSIDAYISCQKGKVSEEVLQTFVEKNIWTALLNDRQCVLCNRIAWAAVCKDVCYQIENVAVHAAFIEAINSYIASTDFDLNERLIAIREKQKAEFIRIVSEAEPITTVIIEYYND